MNIKLHLIESLLHIYYKDSILLEINNILEALRQHFSVMLKVIGVQWIHILEAK